MEFLENYFSAIPSSHRAALLAGGIVFFWLMESIVPAAEFTYQKWKHASFNLFFTFTTIVVNFGFALLIVFCSDLAVRNQWGVIPWLSLRGIPALVAGLLLLDFAGAYVAHWVQHKIPVLWKFHMIHHSDEMVDTTTANRHHPGESVIRAIFTTLAVLIAGAPVWMVMLYQSLSVVLSQFNHANIKLPPRMDTCMRFLLVTPAIHKVHHHYRQPATDTNFGNIFPFWDYLFGTFLKPEKLPELKYGLDQLEGHRTDLLGHQLLLPFRFRKGEKSIPHTAHRPGTGEAPEPHSP